MKANMDGCGALREIPRALLGISFAIAAIAAGLALLPAEQRRRHSRPTPPPRRRTNNVLACHGADGMEKKLADGATLQLHVPGDLFAKSVHSAIGCAGCHADVDLAAHPPEENDIPSKRSFSLAMTQVCRGCHADKFDQWETSIHAALVRNGNSAAPICTSCHNPHAVIKDAATEIDEIPCKTATRRSIPLIQQRACGQPAQFRSELRADLLRLPWPARRETHLVRQARPWAGGRLLRLSRRRAGGTPEMASQCGFAFRGRDLSRLPLSLRATQRRSHADRQQGPSREGPNNRRAAVRRQRPIKRQRDRCGDAMEPAANAQSRWTRREDHLARPPGRSQRSAGASTRRPEQGAQRLPSLSSLGIAGVPERDHLAGRAGGPACGLWRQCRRAELGASLESVSGFYAIGGTRIEILDILLTLAILGGSRRCRRAFDPGMAFQALRLVSPT